MSLQSYARKPAAKGKNVVYDSMISDIKNIRAREG